MERFFCNTRILSGPGSLAALAEFHIERLLIVADPFFHQNGTADRIAHLSGAPATEVFSGVQPDPSATLAAEGTRVVLNFQPDTILALGGGSAMDLAKAMAYFSGLHPRLIAVPTTSGSGSEVTDFSILTHNGIKHPLVDETLRPNVAILDSQLLTSLPPGLIADTGFDLISHAVEAWAATGASLCSDALALSALKVAFTDLPRSFVGDMSVRGNIHTAATMAGMAFSSAGLGLCHAMAHALGGEFHISHGRLNAILLPAVVTLNAQTIPARYGELFRQLGFSSGSDAVALRAFKNGLIRLRRELDLPDSLFAAGIEPNRLREKAKSLTEAILADPCCRTNPVQPTQDAVHRLLREVAGHG